MIEITHLTGETLRLNIVTVELIKEVALEVVHAAAFETAVAFVLRLYFRISCCDLMEIIVTIGRGHVLHFCALGFSEGFEQLFSCDICTHDMIVRNIINFFTVKVIRDHVRSMLGISYRLNSNFVAVVNYVTAGKDSRQGCPVSGLIDINQAPTVSGDVFQTGQVCSLSGGYN